MADAVLSTRRKDIMSSTKVNMKRLQHRRWASNTSQILCAARLELCAPYYELEIPSDVLERQDRGETLTKILVRTSCFPT